MKLSCTCAKVCECATPLNPFLASPKSWGLSDLPYALRLVQVAALLRPPSFDGVAILRFFLLPGEL